jgi:YD repeat-containing protein
MRTIVRHFAANWQETKDASQAAWTETWTYDAHGSLVERKRTNHRKATTISTDPRAGAIMREELGLKASNQMSGPHH